MGDSGRYVAGGDHRAAGASACVCGRAFASAHGLRVHLARVGPTRHGTAHAYEKLGCRCDVCTAANTVRKRGQKAGSGTDGALPERDERAWNGRNAADYGCTVTFENGAGKTLTLSGRGAPGPTFKALCADALRLDASYRVVAYSTPQTILADVQGRGGGAGRGTPELPELALASRFGLLPAVHDRLQRGRGRRRRG